MKRIVLRFFLTLFLPSFLPLLAQTPNNARMLSGVNPQTGTGYAFVPADATRLVTFSNAAPIAATISSPVTFGFGAGTEFDAQNIGVGTVTITCSCVIFSTTSAGASTIQLTSGQGVSLFSSGLTYSALLTGGGGGGGGGNVSTNPAGAQPIIQPGSGGSSTIFSVNNFGNVRFVVPAWNWSQTDAVGSIGNLSVAGSSTLTLTPCPLGIDTTPAAHNYIYAVFVSGTGTPEAARVTGGTCTPGLASGTVIVTTLNTHPAGFTVGSASSGIQEAWNDAWVNDSGAAPVSSSVASPDVQLLAGTTYTVQASVYLRGRGGVLDGRGALIACQTRDRCLYIGTTQGFPFVNHHKVYNLTMTTSVQVNGANVASVSAAAGTYSVQTAAAHPFVLNDTVICEYHSQNVEQKWMAQVTNVADNTHFQVAFGALSFSTSATTFGWCNIENAAIEDNSDHVILQDFNLASVTGIGGGEFNEGIVNDNDQQFQITRATNRSHAIINPSAPNVSTSTWPIGSFFFQRTDQTLAGIMYVHDSELTNVNCADSGGNGFVMENSVCQGFPMWPVRYSGGLQPATLSNVYQEGGGSVNNALYGYAAQSGYILQGGSGGIEIGGTFPIAGLPPTFLSSGGGGACTVSQYFVVAQTSIGRTAPFYIGSSNPTNCNGANIGLQWPSIALQDSTGTSVGTLTWDIIRTIGANTVAPFGTLAGGGVNSGSIATGNSGSCVNGMCSFTDTQAAAAGYTVNSAQIAPVFWFWPASLVVNKGPVYVDSIGTGAGVVSANGALGVSVIAKRCQSTGSTGQKTPSWVQCLATDGGGGSGSIATVLQQHDTAGNGPVANSKGRFNLEKAVTAPNDLITLQDSNLPKTMATPGGRPSNDAGDMALGVDTNGGMSIRSPTSIAQYVGTLQNGSPLEQLAASAKTFTVPVTLPSLSTATNCAVNSVSPAACGAAASGGVVVPTTTTTYTINTSAVTSHSRIFLMPMSFAGDLPSAPTCVVPAITAEPTVSAISAGVSFSFALASTTGQTCWQYWIVN